MEKLIESVGIAIKLGEVDESEDKWDNLERKLAHMVRIFCFYNEERIEEEVGKRLQKTDSLEKLFCAITNIEGDFTLSTVREEDFFEGWQAMIPILDNACDCCGSRKLSYIRGECTNKSPRKALEKLLVELKTNIKKGQSEDHPNADKGL